MNELLTPFAFTNEGWFQLCSFGDKPHETQQVLQRCDQAAFDSIITNFRAEAALPHFPGKLVDFEHGSFDANKPNTEAAGWIIDLAVRGDGKEPADGLYALPRWSDSGQAALQGGRYRFVSPVWLKSDCQVVEPGVLRPLKLYNAGLTNHANIRGMAPITNACRNRNCTFNGIPLTIDRPKGFVQSGCDDEGNDWTRTYSCDYGFIKKTDGGDSEDLDVFNLGDESAKNAYWIVQQKPDGSFDEFKLMLGASDESHAKKVYLEHVPERFFQSIHSVPVASLHAMLRLKPKQVMDRFTPLNLSPSVEPIVNMLVHRAVDAIMNRYYTKEQLAAIHAKGGFGGGGGRGPNGGGGGAGGNDTPTAEAPPLTPAVPGRIYGSRTDWDAQIKAQEAERDAIIAQRREPTPPPDYTLHDIEKIDRAMWEKNARGEITAEQYKQIVADYQAENDATRAELKKIRDDIKKKFPHDKDRQKAEFQKMLEREERRFGRETEAARKYNDYLDLRIASKDRQIAELVSNRDSELAMVQERSVIDDVAAAVKEQRQRKLEADAKAREQRRQEEADRRALERANKPKQTPEQLATTESRREKTRSREYWDRLKAGELDWAERLYPGKDHKLNQQRQANIHSKDAARQLRDSVPL